MLTTLLLILKGYLIIGGLFTLLVAFGGMINRADFDKALQDGAKATGYPLALFNLFCLLVVLFCWPQVILSLLTSRS